MSSKWKTGKYVFEMLTPKPKVKKELSESARGLRLLGWAKRMRKKLKND